VFTRSDCRALAAIIAATGRGDDRRNLTGDRSSNPLSGRRRYADYIDQK